MAKIKIQYLKTGAGPEPQHNFQAGQIAEVDQEFAQTLINDRAAIPVGPVAPEKASSRAAKETR